MRRRTYLGATTAALVGGLAGCANPTDEEETEEAGGEDETETTPAGGTITEAEPTTEQATTTEEETTEDGEATTEAGETTEEGETTAGEETTEPGETTAGGGGTQTVEMITEGEEYYFDPIGLAVEPGTTVEWVNESGAHSATAYAEGNGGAEVTRIPEDAEPWDSGTLTESGATFSYTFETEGTYDYFCIPHKALEMVGRVVCGDPGDVDGDPPDGAVPDAETIADEGSVAYGEFEG